MDRRVVTTRTPDLLLKILMLLAITMAVAIALPAGP
jgi:hypothetical protein